jgi:lipopolysaccharide biosynthesis regulator YciM
MDNITIAIHLLFKSKQENTMFIAHYLCEPSEEPVYGDKFMSAISKLKVDLSRFEKTIGLNTLINLDKATSLPKLKEHSIVHHIEVMSKY